MAASLPVNGRPETTPPCGPVRLQLSRPSSVRTSKATCFGAARSKVKRFCWPACEIVPSVRVPSVIAALLSTTFCTLTV